MNRRGRRQSSESWRAFWACRAGGQPYDIDRIGQLSERSDELTLRVDTRSVLGSMAYLSQAVDVPPEHVERRLVSRNAELEAVLWELLRIKVTEKAPEHAIVSVPYRGSFISKKVILDPSESWGC